VTANACLTGGKRHEAEGKGQEAAGKAKSGRQGNNDAAPFCARGCAFPRSEAGLGSLGFSSERFDGYETPREQKRPRLLFRRRTLHLGPRGDGAAYSGGRESSIP